MRGPAYIDDHRDRGEDDTLGEVERRYDVEMTVRATVYALGPDQAAEYAAASKVNWHDWDVVTTNAVKEATG